MSPGESKTVPEAKELINTIRLDLDAMDIYPPAVKKVIDWGPKARGQGRRSGSMVKGSMSAAPYGLKTYVGIDMSEYKDEDLSWGQGFEMTKYYRARKFGCNHIESRYYAIT